jgi:hypothetical protein
VDLPTENWGTGTVSGNIVNITGGTTLALPSCRRSWDASGTNMYGRRSYSLDYRQKEADGFGACAAAVAVTAQSLRRSAELHPG